MSPGSSAVAAGRVGRAHGLDGSFYVTGARPRLLVLGAEVMFGERSAVIVRRAGTDEHPIVRLEGIEDRGGAEALRGTELTVELAAAPELEEGEWWAQELEGCEVVDGQRRVGTVVGLIELPSCEALRVRLLASPAGDEGHTRLHASPADGDSQAAGAPGAELLVPMVRDAIRHVDPAAGRIEVDMSFLEEMQ